MKNFNNLLVIILFNIILFNTAESATYYVNTATGNNNNSSSQAQNIVTPWLTVQYAIDNAAVLSGDNIVVAEGSYSGFVLTKRLNIIGAWKGSNPSVNTVFNSGVTLSATGGSPAERMLLKNLRIDGSSGDAVDIRKSYVTLENVFAVNSGANGVRINETGLLDVRIEACNINNNVYAGIYFPTFSGIDGFVLKNSTVNNNGYFGIVAFQRRINPTEIKNVRISHCSFADNNTGNQQQGHTIYFEKLKNSVFENISVVMPAGNSWIGIDINLLSRQDYSNISIINSRIIRSSPGSGIWIQARNDLNDPPSALDTVLLRGVNFSNCDTNLAFNRQVKNMTVDKCDLSNYTRYGLVNYTDQGGTITANNNKWKNGEVPDTTVISGGLLVTGSNIISLMPSTVGIFVGMGIVGTGIPPGTTVIGKSPNTIIMSSNATVNGFISEIGFAFNFATSTDIVRTSLNFVTTANPLPNAIVNQANVSYPDLSSAITGTSAGGTIWNLPSGTISGVTHVSRNLKLIGPGAGFLHSLSLTTFEFLSVETDSFKMGSDFAVTNNIVDNGTGGTIGATFIGEDNTLIINGPVNADTRFTGGETSDMFIGGASGNTGLPAVQDGLRTLQLNRANGITLLASLRLHRLLFLQSGLLTAGGNNLTLAPDATIFAPNSSSSYISTNGTGSLRKNYNQSSPTYFNFTVGAGSYSPNSILFTNWNLSGDAYVSSRVVNSKHPNNGCLNDFLNRYWVVNQNNISGINADTKFSYVSGDVVGNEANIDGARFNGYLWSLYGPVNAAANTFTANNINGFGDFTGGGPGCINNAFTEINTKAILQGAYLTGGEMRVSLNTFGLIPLSQPYNTPQYDYNGTESVTSIPAGVVDWVYLELRLTDSGLPVPNGRRAAFIKSDGSVVDLDGISHVKLPGLTPGNYFIVIGHRVHLPVMTTNAEPLSLNSPLYDFTTGVSKYYGADAKDLGDGLFAMYGGDANRTFIVTAADYAVVTNNLLQSNYNFGDLNLNGTVTAADYFYITSNLAISSNVPNYP